MFYKNLKTLKLKEIYQRYFIPDHLAKHMLEVAAVGQLITKSWQGPEIRSQLVTSTLLVHDIGNLVKFDLSDTKPGALNRNLSDIPKWQKIQRQLQERYSKNAETANVKIMQELGFPQTMVSLMQEHTFEALPIQLNNQQWEHLICTYADLRIAPQGLVSITNRLQDLRERYRKRDADWSQPETYQQRLTSTLQTEAKLDELTQVSLPNITQKQLRQIVNQLTEYEFHLE